MAKDADPVKKRYWVDLDHAKKEEGHTYLTRME
jgi:hypothetical protein